MPFGSFKSIDYNYVPKHNLEVIGQTYDYLQQRHDAAVAQESALKKQIGELELNAQEDEFKQTLINSIENKIQDAVVGDFKGYALDEIIAEAGNVASDPRVIGRLRAQQQYKTYHDNLNARTDLSEDYKNYYRQVNTYHYEDKLDAAGNIIGGTEWKPEKQEVSEVPTSVIYNEALKIAQADAGGGESYSFLDVNGNPTNDYTKSATGEMFMKSGNKWERLSEDKLQHAIDAAIEGTPGAKASLQQDYDIALWKDKTQSKNADVRDNNGNLMNYDEFINRRFNNFKKAAAYNRSYNTSEFGTALASAKKIAATSGGVANDNNFANVIVDGAPLVAKNESAIEARANIQNGKSIVADIFSRNGIQGDINSMDTAALRQHANSLPNSPEKLEALNAIKSIEDNTEFMNKILGVNAGTEAGNAFETYTALSSGTDIPDNQFRNGVNQYMDAIFDENTYAVRQYLNDDEYTTLVKNLGGDNALKSLGIRIGRENGMQYVELPRQAKNNTFNFSKAVRDARNQNTNLFKEMIQMPGRALRGLGFIDYDKTKTVPNAVKIGKNGEKILDVTPTELSAEGTDYGSNTSLGGIMNNFANFGDDLNRNAEAIIQQDVTMPTEIIANVSPTHAQAEYNLKHGIGKPEDNKRIMDIEEERFKQALGNIDFTQTPNTYIYDEDTSTYREMDTEEEMKYTNIIANAKENLTVNGITYYADGSIRSAVTIKDPKNLEKAPKRIQFGLNPVMSKDWLNDTNTKAGIRLSKLRSYKYDYNIGNSPYTSNIGKYQIDSDLNLINKNNNKIIRQLTPIEAQDLIEKDIRLDEAANAYVTGQVTDINYLAAIINSVAESYSKYLYNTTDYKQNIANAIGNNLTEYR